MPAIPYFGYPPAHMLQKPLHALLTAAILVSFGSARAQCDGCTPDLTCTASPAFPTLCPADAPDATAGEYYEADFTFWMPPSFTDPGSGFSVNLLQITITGVTGLPFGLAFTANEPSGVYYPPENEYGCARVCGTPIIPGSYPVTIDVLAHVSASGITLDVPQSFTTNITVLPGAGGNSSFAYSPTAGCGSVTAGFEALIDGSPSPTSYAWDFGNGNSSSLATPPDQTYADPGDYTVVLETVIGGYVLGTVTVTGVNGNWCGDIEEPNLPLVGCTGSPDLYFVLTDANGGSFTSGTVDNTATAQWNNVDQLLDTPPYSISIYDEDAVSGDDLLGTYNIPQNGEGTYFINVAGGTTGSLVITNVPQQTFLDSAVVTVMPLPEVVIEEVAGTGQLCALDQSFVAYAWLLDGVDVPGLSGPCIDPTGPGVWLAVATNSAGCSDTSNALVVCPDFEIVRNGAVLVVPSGYASYAWTYNGAPVGGNDPFVILQGDGVYALEVDAGNGCTLSLTYVHDTTGIGEWSEGTRPIAVFPNPNDGGFSLVAERLASATVDVTISDAAGRVVHRVGLRPTMGRLQERFSLPLAPGSYILEVRDSGSALTYRVLVR